MKINSTNIGVPFSTSTEEEKEELTKKLERYKARLNDQWLDMKEDVVGHSKRAAVIGGIILGVYGLMEVLLPKATDDLPSEEELPAAEEPRKRHGGLTLSGALQSILWTAAMGWAKQKITDFVVADKHSEIEDQE